MTPERGFVIHAQPAVLGWCSRRGDGSLCRVTDGMTDGATFDGKILPDAYEDQWPRFDGNYIAPFVASDRAMIAAAAEIIGTRMSQPVAAAPHPLLLAHPALASLPAIVPGEDTVVDLGCGDGRALSMMTRATGLHGIGVDLDAALIDVANRTFAATFPTGATLSFEIGDLCDESVVASIAQRATIIFLFLLPSAMEILQDAIKTLCQRAKFVISNKWPVPFLEDFRVAHVPVAEELTTSEAGAWTARRLTVTSPLRNCSPTVDYTSIQHSAAQLRQILTMQDYDEIVSPRFANAAVQSTPGLRWFYRKYW